MTRISVLLAIAFSFVSASTIRIASAQTSITISGQEISYLFGKHIAFEAIINTNVIIQEVTIFFQVQGDSETYFLTAELDKDQKVTGVYDLTQGKPINAFSTINYWFRITLTDIDEVIETNTFSFYYEDNRFDWSPLEKLPFVIHTYQEDLEFSQTILNAAQKGLLDASELLNLPNPDLIHFYVYSKTIDLQFALNLTSQSWVAGHTDPSNGIILISITPGPEQNLEITRQVPHEIAHALLYQTNRDGYANIPVWLNEGIASLLEGFPNPDYEQNLQTAVENNNLFALTHLCDLFPIDASGAGLAYAQSASFVNYLFGQVGSAGLNQMIANYGGGAGCENGTNAVFGMGLSQLDRNWRSAVFQENRVVSAFVDLIPWIGLMVLILIAPLAIMLTNKFKRDRPT